MGVLPTLDVIVAANVVDIQLAGDLVFVVGNTLEVL